jgi:osmoprotectant transport system permease protein
MSATTSTPPAGKETAAGAPRVLRLAGPLIMPVFLSLVCASLYLYVGAAELDSIEQRSLNRASITSRLVEHLQLTGWATVAVVLIAVPLGILLTRPFARRLLPAVIGLANTGQAVPSIGLIVLLALLLGIGARTAVLALIAYSMLPVLRNTMVGLQGVDRAAIKAGRGMGMSPAGVLARIELPLAVPVILAGIRIALILNVGTATLATLIDAGGLGDIINNGIVLNRRIVLLTGSILTAAIALALDWVAGIAEAVLRPKGL